MNPQKIKKMFGIDEMPLLDLALADIPLKAQEMAGRMSISGVQPKLSLKLNKRKKELLPSASGGEYILKPQIQPFQNIPENENCCMDIAEDMGIEVPPHCLILLKDKSYAYIIKRFDRKGKQKIHQEDFCQVLEKKDKYSGSLEEIGKKINRISEIPGLDVQLFFERVVFNFLIGNGDGHYKNYSISYYEDKGVRLSPVYDIVCSKLVIPNEWDSALTINGKKNKLERRDFDQFAQLLQMPEKVRYEKFSGKFGQMKKGVEASRLPSESIEKFIEVIQSRYERLEL